MKQAIELASLLELHASTTIDEKWKAAWSLLDGDSSSNSLPQYRWHARCWLTYRGIEGHVRHAEMMQRVLAAPIDPPLDRALMSRWSTSQAAAAFYYFTLRDMKDASSMTEIFNDSSHLNNHPPSILSTLRVKCILSYSAFLQGNYQKTQQIIESALESWIGTSSNILWLKSPLHRIDMPAAAMPLHALMYLGSRIGMCNEDEWRGHASCIQNLKDPWVICLKQLGRRKDSIWI